MTNAKPRGLKRIGLALAWLLCLGCESGDRGKELLSVSSSLGLGYAKEFSPALAEVFRSMPGVTYREKNFFSNVLSSDRVVVFDWTWREGMLKEHKRERQTLVAVRIEQGGLPSFVWTERGALSRPELRALDGVVEFEGVPDFADRFDVAGRDRSAVREVFAASRRASLKLPSGMIIEGHGDWLVGYRAGKEIPPNQLAERIQEMEGIAAGFSERF